jgi:hypothetical protein
VFLEVLKLFEDRGPELALFHQMLRGESDRQILLVLDDIEKGKTWLIWRLFHECRQQDVPVVLLDFDRDRSGLAGDVDSVVSEVRGYLGDERTPHVCACTARMGLLPSLADRVASGPAPGVDFGQSNIFTDAEISSIAGRDIWQVGAVFTGPLTPEQQAQRQADLGRALCHDLGALGRAVLLIDTFERAPEDTRAWLERWLFRALSRELSDVILVVAGRPEKCRPFFAQPRLWSDLIAPIDCLTPFSEDEVLGYYARRGVVVSAREVSLIAIACTNPGRMAQVGDWLEQTKGGAR